MNYIVFKCNNCRLVDLMKQTDEVDACPICGVIIEPTDVVKHIKSNDDYWTLYRRIERTCGKLTFYAKN